MPLFDLLDPNLSLQALVFFDLFFDNLLVGVPNILRFVVGARGVLAALGGIWIPFAAPLAIDVQAALVNTSLQSCNCYKKLGEPS